MNPQTVGGNSMAPEDQNMFFKQVVCAKCLNRFTTLEDTQLHIAFFHDKEPRPSEIMKMLKDIRVEIEVLKIQLAETAKLYN